MLGIIKNVRADGFRLLNDREGQALALRYGEAVFFYSRLREGQALALRYRKRFPVPGTIFP